MDKLDGDQQSNVVDIDSQAVLEASKSVFSMPFVMVSRNLIQKSGLSLEARMLIIYLISFNDGWRFYNNKIQKDLEMGRDRLKKSFSELSTKGYIKNIRLKNSKGRIVGVKKIFSAFPEFLNDARLCSEVLEEVPNYGEIHHETGNQSCGDMPVENLQNPDLSSTGLKTTPMETHTCGDQHLNITSINKTNINNNNPLKPPRGGRSRSSFPKEFEAFWFHYPKKVDKSKAFERFNTILSEDNSLYDVMIEAIKAQNLERRAKLSKNLWHADPKGPAAWLRDKRWEDEVITNQEQLDEEVRRTDSGKSGLSHKSAKFSEVMRESRKRTEAAIRSAGLTPRSQQQLSESSSFGASSPAIQQVQALLPGELAEGG